VAPAASSAAGAAHGAVGTCALPAGASAGGGAPIGGSSEAAAKTSTAAPAAVAGSRVTVSSAGNIPLDKPFATGPSANKDKPLAAGRKVFITAEAMNQRLAIAGNGALELAVNEFLTPAAEDVIERRHVTVHKAAASIPLAAPAGQPAGAAQTVTPAPAGAQVAAAPASAGGSLGVVLEKPDTKVQLLLNSLGGDKLDLLSYNQTDCWMRNLQALGAAIVAGQVAAGVAVLPYGADAMLLAGKIPGIRAVQGTSVAGVAAAVRHYGANLLVLEHAINTPHQMRSMIQQFAAPRPAPIHQPLMAAVAQLEGR